MKIIYTSDNKFCFKEEDYISHVVEDYAGYSSKLIVFTKNNNGGQEIKYSREAAIRYPKEIIDQLKDK